jgi:hypothetical protein
MLLIPNTSAISSMSSIVGNWSPRSIRRALLPLQFSDFAILVALPNLLTTTPLSVVSNEHPSRLALTFLMRQA